MDDHRLEPWMLRSDWRSDSRTWLYVDFSRWPAETPIAPLPPVPVLGLAGQDHPQTGSVDAIPEGGITLRILARSIEHTPLAAATLVQLLRATATIPADAALLAESFAYATLQGGAEHSAWLGELEAGAPSPPGQVHLDRQAGQLVITLDRPWARNAIDRPMRDGLFDGFSLAVMDAEVTAIRLAATGQAFSVGADLAEFGTTADPVAAHAIRARTLPAGALLRRRVPLSVHVQGACVGSGVELMAFADRVTASCKAWFQLPELGMGILPGFGGTVSLPRRIGRQKAALMILSGRRISAETALRWGLVDALVDDPAADPGGANMR